MGVVLNRFDKLYELKGQEQYSGCSQYKLVAVIVHNPKDHSLCEHIRENFIDFAEMTGKNFLFLTFIQPPTEYLKKIRSGQYPMAKLMLSDCAQGKDVETLVAPLLRNYYDIKEEEYSYIIISQGLSAKSFYKVRITCSSLPYQLLKIKRYCDTPDDLSKLLQELDAEAYDANEALIDSLLKITSLISPRTTEYKCDYRYPQRKIALQIFKEEKEKIKTAMRHLSEDKSDKVLELYDLIEHTYINVFCDGRKEQVEAEKCENFSLFDKHSKMFWKTYDRLRKYISEKDRDELDYSAFTLYLGKIVENELNLSICQMVRKAMGINMPEFYNRYCYRMDKVEIPTLKMDVPVNKYKKDNNGKKYLESVPLGNLLYAYKTAVGIEAPYYDWEVPFPDDLEDLPEEFLLVWEQIAHIRNNAAHTGNVDKTQFNQAKNLFKKFQDFYEDIYIIKQELRPRTNYERRI